MNFSVSSRTSETIPGPAFAAASSSDGQDRLVSLSCSPPVLSLLAELCGERSPLPQFVLGCEASRWLALRCCDPQFELLRLGRAGGGCGNPRPLPSHVCTAVSVARSIGGICDCGSRFLSGAPCRWLSAAAFCRRAPRPSEGASARCAVCSRCRRRLAAKVSRIPYTRQGGAVCSWEGAA